MGQNINAAARKMLLVTLDGDAYKYSTSTGIDVEESDLAPEDWVQIEKLAEGGHRALFKSDGRWGRWAACMSS